MLHMRKLQLFWQELLHPESPRDQGLAGSPFKPIVEFIDQDVC